MDQVKIGEFLKELRKEKELTQEQLAERFNVSRRSVSRWETGNSMPDLAILVELADFYEVDLRELIEGERKAEQLDADVKDTLVKAAEYSAKERRIERRRMCRYFAIAGICLLLAILNARFGILTMIFKSPVDEFAERALTCIGIGFGIAGFMFDSREAKQTRNWLGLMKQEMLMRRK